MRIYAAASLNFRLRRSDGSQIWVRISSGPVSDASGTLVGTIGLFTDITGSKRAEERKRQLSHSQQGELTTDIAAELRQPLTAISLNVDAAEAWLRSETPDVHELNELLRDIRADTWRTHALIKRMLDLMVKRGAAGEPLD